MKEKRNYTILTIIIGAMAGSIASVLFSVKFPVILTQLTRLILGSNPRNFLDPLYNWKVVLQGSLTLFFRSMFILAGMMIAFKILSLITRKKELNMKKTVINNLIVLGISPFVFGILSFCGLYFFGIISKFFGYSATMLGMTFPIAMVGAVFGLFLAILMQCQKRSIVMVFTGLIIGWGCSLLYYYLLLILDESQSILRMLISLLGIPFIILLVGIAFALIEKLADIRLKKENK